MRRRVQTLYHPFGPKALHPKLLKPELKLAGAVLKASAVPGAMSETDIDYLKGHEKVHEVLGPAGEHTLAC